MQLKTADMLLLSLVKNKSKINDYLKMDSITAVSYANKMGWGQILNFDQNSQELMGIVSCKGGHSDCRAPTKSPKSNSRLGEPEGNRSNNLKLNNKVFSHVNRQVRSNQTGFNCRKTKCSGEILCQLEARSNSGGNRCIHDKMDVQASIRLPSILSNTEMY